MAKSSAKSDGAPPKKHPGGAHSKRWDKLLQAAALLFAEKGYEATSMQDIADSVGVLKGSLYHYVDSKEKILFEIINDTFELGVRNVGAIEAGLEPEERIRALVDKHIDFLLNNVTTSRALLHESAALTGEYRKIVDVQNASYTNVFRRAIVDGQNAGVFNLDLNSDYACNFVLGACNWVYRWHDDSANVSHRQLRKQFADMVVAALKAPQR